MSTADPGMADQSATPHSPTSTTHPSSLLDPPNPSLQPVQPPGSILLNRNDPSCLPPSQLAALGILNGNNSNSNSSSSGSGGNRSRVASAIKSSFSIKDIPSGNVRMPGPPASTFNRRSRGNSIGAGPSTSVSGSLHRSGSTSSSSRSPLVQFAPLPHVPELERRRSITLGVAARSAMLKTQGSPAANAGGGGGGGGGPGGITGGQRGTGGGRGKGQVLMMTDQEWEEYKKSIQQRNNQTEDPPEIHHFVKKGTKKLWKKARRMSSSSNASSSSSRTSTDGSPKNVVGTLPGSSKAATSSVTPRAVAVPTPTTSSTTGANLNVPDSTSSTTGTSPSGRNRNGLISRMRLDPPIGDPGPDPERNLDPNHEISGEGTHISGLAIPGITRPSVQGEVNDEVVEDDDMSVSDGMSDVFGSSLSESVILEEPENEMEEDDDVDMDEDGEDDGDGDGDEDEDELASSYFSSSSTSSSTDMRRIETPGERRERHRLEEEDEMRDQGKIPEYLRKDSAVEQYRYQHVHDLVQEGATTPRERREGLSHAGLTDRLSKLQMGARDEGRGGENGPRASDGDETPRRRTSPKGEHRVLPIL